MKETVTVAMIKKEQDSKKKQKLYQTYVEQMTPTHSCIKNIFHAFLVGGLICTLGQVFENIFLHYGVNQENAKLYMTISLVLLSVILTGLNWYPRIAKYGGAGTLVPITGFANSVAAAALDYKVQGQVFGIGCFIFSIAGPVILYGIMSSWFFGLLYWLLK